jgi:hypothetical protein
MSEPNFKSPTEIRYRQAQGGGLLVIDIFYWRFSVECTRQLQNNVTALGRSMLAQRKISK